MAAKMDEMFIASMLDVVHKRHIRHGHGRSSVKTHGVLRPMWCMTGNFPLYRRKAMSSSGGSSPGVSANHGQQQPPQLRVLQLNDGEHRQSDVFRLQKGWTLHFQLGPSLLGKKVHVFTNHPASASAEFDRGEYRELAWQQKSSTSGDDSDVFVEVLCGSSGCFNYFFLYEGGGSILKPNGSGYFLIDPVLTVGAKNEEISLDCLQCQTVLSKCLGPLDEWEGRLMVTKETGYSAFHFTPVQDLGKSNSAYCIKDQLSLNRTFQPGQPSTSMKTLAPLIKKIRDEWKMLSICDIVLNHSANESPWLKEHPECAYNLVNSPHLRPAYILDRALWNFNSEVAAGKWEERGLSSHLTTEEDLRKLLSILHDEIIPKGKIEEFFILNVETLVEEFRDKALDMGPCANRVPEGSILKVVQDPAFRRLQCSVDMNMALNMYNHHTEQALAEEDRVVMCCASFRGRLHELNHEAEFLCSCHLKQAEDCLIAAQRYYRLQADGPKWKAVTEKQPISSQYFTHPVADTCLEDDEKLMDSPRAAWVMAHNGWVMNDDPLKNFAELPSIVYLRRELLAWGDSVKLKYGKRPEDNPILWKHMKTYVEETARIFQGVRLDNCHSTPIHVGEYLLDAARKIQPDLYVVAELFTSNEKTDNIFVNRLGITSLIREAMQAWDSHELGRIVHRYGGEPVGTFMQPPARPLMPCIAHALLVDQTHDNKCPVQVRSVYDLLPNAALVSMACCASGSTRGYDELVSYQLDVVTEDRLYKSWSDAPALEKGYVGLRSGIIAGKRALNKLHHYLGEQGYNQVYVDQVDKNIVSVTRHCPNTHQSVILVARTAFENPQNIRETGEIPPLCIPGVVDEIVLEARLVPRPGSPARDDRAYIAGLADYACELSEHVPLKDSHMVELSHEGEHGLQVVDFTCFTPGSVIAFKVSLNSTTRAAVVRLRSSLAQFGYRLRSCSGSRLQPKPTDFHSIAQRMSLPDLNVVLYRCDAEERDDAHGFGVYNVPEHGELVYCGLQGFMSALQDIRSKNDLGHPLCENLRNGDWMPQYLAARLLKHPGTKELGLWFEQVFSSLAEIPRYLIPCYFDAIVSSAYTLILETTWNNMSEFVKNGSAFVKALALGSVQMCGQTKNAHLPTLSPNLEPPSPPVIINEGTGRKEQACCTLAAGLPHFSTGIMRSWGRDTFIALPGLLLLTGRYQDARQLILAYGGCMRHGLIPNLLGGGAHARFNCRDSVWWWMQCIQDYCKLVPEGHRLLKDKVSRIYPTDDSLPEEPGFFDQPLEDVIHEALQRHYQGVEFSERNAGMHLDEHMSWKVQCSMVCVLLQDTYGARRVWADFQLRCNFPIAMVVAPELFDVENAWTALNTMEEVMLGPLGMKTLDPSDWLYRGNYDNSNYSNDGSVANGFNYHCGPEWVWPVGYFLRAKLYFASRVAEPGALDNTISKVKSVLSHHYKEIQRSPWRGLPELTNQDGAFCRDSSPTQAWSMSAILEVMYDLHNLK
ncbi:PREDICTED: glycogen debranching enzyme-like [Priapulus caudatus]|uniref:Glycogen debranching enzyme-like n=1 Tax=Priapulus caudatus TaxID=37621 RepID=A0ABM1EXA3_PRICU|nr:PREDICTED: glycogen debranching enzyme-like [Priapulus caudatus]